MLADIRTELQALVNKVPDEEPPWLVHYMAGCLVVLVKGDEQAAAQKAIELLTNKLAGAGDGPKASLSDLRAEWERLDTGNYERQQEDISRQIGSALRRLKQATGEEC